MKLLIRNIKLVLILFLTVSLALLGGLVWQQHRATLEFSVATNETPAALAARYTRAGSILGRDGSILAQTAAGKRSYHTDPLTAQAMIHLVGDHTGRIGNTVETQWVGSLTGTDRFLPHQLLLDLTGHGLEGDDVVLTADPSLSRRAAELLSGLRGAIVLLDYKTGEVIVSVSSPGTSPANVFRWENIPDTALFDRARMGAYAPGSVFKIDLDTEEPVMRGIDDKGEVGDPFAARAERAGDDTMGVRPGADVDNAILALEIGEVARKSIGESSHARGSTGSGGTDFVPFHRRPHDENVPPAADDDGLGGISSLPAEAVISIVHP